MPHIESNSMPHTESNRIPHIESNSMPYYPVLLPPIGCQRPIKCLISCVTFRKLATNHTSLLRKMTYKDKASYASSPPCSPNSGTLEHSHTPQTLTLSHTWHRNSLSNTPTRHNASSLSHTRHNSLSHTHMAPQLSPTLPHATMHQLSHTQTSRRATLSR